jgi:hypothetical protein
MKSSTSVRMESVDNFYCFRLPANVIIAARTGSGKSSLMLEIIKHRKRLVNILPSRIIWSYSVDQPGFFKTFPKEVELHQGLPDLDSIGVLHGEGKHTWIIIDDLTDALNTEISKLFTIYSHKKFISSFLLCQNFYDKNVHLRTITLNTHYLIIFPNPRNPSQFFRIAAQIFPSKYKSLIKVYEEIAKTPYNYLLIDTSILCPEHLRVRSDILNPNGSLVYMLTDNE